MNWEELAVGIALVLVIEGILPFVSPATLKKTYFSVTQMPDSMLRWVGLSSMVLGIVLLHWVRD